jgi:Zn-dependent M16 (insulinase) family peptidase
MLLTSCLQATVSFTNQALKDVPALYHVELLEKFQAVTKEDVLAVLQNHFLPLCNPSSSVAVVVTAPGKADEIAQNLGELGYEVERRTLDVDPSELEELDSESGSSSSDSA